MIYLKEGRLEQGEMSWGLRPGWSKRPVINAQAETIQQKPTFRESFLRRRCLIPADGFYEWRQPDKTQFWFRQPNQETFCFAGLWEDSPSAGGKAAYVIITVAATAVVQPVHHRMPLILGPDSYDDWLMEPGKAAAMLQDKSPVELRAEAMATKAPPRERQEILPL
jgi:putative SOS response-associated peptidase YedK